MNNKKWTEYGFDLTFFRSLSGHFSFHISHFSFFFVPLQFKI